MSWRPNPWAFGAIAFCAAFWAIVGFASVKLADAYVSPAARDVRHAMEARLDHRLQRLMRIVDGRDGAA